MKRKLLVKYHFWGEAAGKRQPRRKKVEEEVVVEDEEEVEESDKEEVNDWVQRVLDARNGRGGRAPPQRGAERGDDPRPIQRPQRPRYEPKKPQKVLET